NPWWMNPGVERRGCCVGHPGTRPNGLSRAATRTAHAHSSDWENPGMKIICRPLRVASDTLPTLPGSMARLLDGCAGSRTCAFRGFRGVQPEAPENLDREEHHAKRGDRAGESDEVGAGVAVHPHPHRDHAPERAHGHDRDLEWREGGPSRATGAGDAGDEPVAKPGDEKPGEAIEVCGDMSATEARPGAGIHGK